MAIPISNVPRRVQYAASGVGPYAFTFEILVNTDIAVYQGNTLLTLTADYTVTINPNGTGSVTLTSSATGAITIVGARAIQRTTDFVTGGDFRANTVNDEMDSQTIFSQQLAEELGRSIKVPVTDSSSVGVVLPFASDRAGAVLAFDGDGSPIVGPNIASVGTIESNISNINTVANNISDVNTVASDISDVSNVASISNSIVSVSSNSSDISLVADNIDDVLNVSNNLDDVTNFSDVYQGAKTSDPVLRNNGNALQAGDLYFNTVDNELRVYSGVSWDYGSFNLSDVNKFEYEIGVTPGTSVGQTVFSGIDLSGSSAVEVFYNGSLLYEGKDYTYTASELTLTDPTSNGDIVIIYNYRFPVSVIDGGVYS